VPTIFLELDGVTAGLESGLGEWKQVFPKIESYLEYGIVPSNLLENPGELRFHTPSLIALLNSAYKFYVQLLDTLLNHIDGANVGDVACRSDWATKVQTWTAKAIEDCNVLRAKTKGTP